MGEVLAVMRTALRYVLGVADQGPQSRVKRVRELIDEFWIDN